MLLPAERNTAAELNEKYLEERNDVVESAFEIFDQKGRKYDVSEPFWHRYRDAGAFVHELEKKTRRLSQVHEADPVAFVETPEHAAYGESVLEQLLDVINNAVMLHWVLSTNIEQAEELNGKARKAVRRKPPQQLPLVSVDELHNFASRVVNAVGEQIDDEVTGGEDV